MTNGTVIDIPGRLHAIDSNGITTGADEIFDDDLGRLQSEINKVVLEELTPVTYDELVDLINNSQLIPGRKYRITDYQSEFINYESAGHNFDVVVTAKTNNTISKDATAMQHEGDNYFGDGILKWKLEYDINRKGNYCYLDGYLSNSINSYKNPRFPSKDSPGSEFPYRWGNNNSRCVYTKTLKPIAGDEVNTKANGTGTSGTVTEIRYGKGSITRMIDEFGNSLPIDFKNILQKRYIYSGLKDDIIISTDYDENTLENKIIKKRCLGEFNDGYNHINYNIYRYRTTRTKISSGEYKDYNGNVVTVNPQDYYVQLGINNEKIYCKEDSETPVKDCYIFDYNGTDGSLTGYIKNNIFESSYSAVFIISSMSSSNPVINNNVFKGDINRSTFGNYFNNNIFKDDIDTCIFGYAVNNNIFERKIQYCKLGRVDVNFNHTVFDYNHFTGELTQVTICNNYNYNLLSSMYNVIFETYFNNNVALEYIKNSYFKYCERTNILGTGEYYISNSTYTANMDSCDFNNNIIDSIIIGFCKNVTINGSANSLKLTNVSNCTIDYISNTELTDVNNIDINRLNECIIKNASHLEVNHISKSTIENASYLETNCALNNSEIKGCDYVNIHYTDNTAKTFNNIIIEPGIAGVSGTPKEIVIDDYNQNYVTRVQPANSKVISV